jgi:hypothetical protein
MDPQQSLCTILAGDRYVGEQINGDWKLINARGDHVCWEWCVCIDGIMKAVSDATIVSQWQTPEMIAQRVNELMMNTVRVIHPNEYA